MDNINNIQYLGLVNTVEALNSHKKNNVMKLYNLIIKLVY